MLLIYKGNLMVSGINNIEQSLFQPQLSPPRVSTSGSSASMNNFDAEDEAIISSEAKMQYELEKFNAGCDNLVELMTSSVIAKTTVSAEVNVINAKKDMMDEILKMGE